jgi:hypothetical protein
MARKENDLQMFEGQYDRQEFTLFQREDFGLWGLVRPKDNFQLGEEGAGSERSTSNELQRRG